MLFCSQQFLLFFLVVFTAYWCMPWPRARVYLLLAASFYFYASWNRWLALIICVSTVMDYYIARGLEASPCKYCRRVLLTTSLVANLGLLVYFKYANFFLFSVAQALNAMGHPRALPVLSVILPIGISFYTFEAINYTIDVYRRRVPAERNLANFMLFILFFPHLVAGPIVRARDFLPQTHRRKQWDWARMNLGAQLFLMGLFKKMAIADRMAMLVDPVYAAPTTYSTAAVWFATLAYAIQIYCDFSGYTDMALGAAHMLGYKLAQNFNMPYLSLNVSEFWRRWHISLSGWLRDYLFIPLGGSRGGGLRTSFNLMATMALGGLWHGASWTFVAWGVLHGSFLILHRVFRQWADPRPRVQWLLGTGPGVLLRVALTFLCVCAGWVLFRSPGFQFAADIFHRLVVPSAGYRSPVPTYTVWTLFAVLGIAHYLAHRDRWRRISYWLPAPAMGFGYALCAAVAMLLAPPTGKAFIYFQF